MRGTPLGIRLFTRPAVAAASTTVWATATDYTRTNFNLTTERTAAAGFWGLDFGSASAVNFNAAYTIVAIGAAAAANTYVGIGLTNITTAPGLSGSEDGIGWESTGTIVLDSTGIASIAGFTTNDVPEIHKSGKNFTFWLNGVQQNLTSTVGLGTITTVDISDVHYGYTNWANLAAAAYPVISTGNSALGYKVTLAVS